MSIRNVDIEENREAEIESWLLRYEEDEEFLDDSPLVIWTLILLVVFVIVCCSRSSPDERGSG